jgi:DNA-3-methyladenine glycosylase
LRKIPYPLNAKRVLAIITYLPKLERAWLHTFMKKLPRSFYDRDARTVALDLLGKVLVHAIGGVTQVGRIVEVEAYLGPHDLAAHSARGLTARTRVMFGPPGHAYVYMIYGLHCCMNVVTEAQGTASAVLLRAVEPLENIAGRTQGPGLLCRAMNIDRDLNGADLLGPTIYIASLPVPKNSKPPLIVKRPRIGVDYAGHWARRLLRFYIKGNAFISKP